MKLWKCDYVMSMITSIVADIFLAIFLCILEHEMSKLLWSMIIL